MMQTNFYLTEGLTERDQPVLVADGLGQLMQTVFFYLAEGLAGWDQPVFVADGLGQLTQTGFYLAEGLAGWDQPVLVADGQICWCKLVFTWQKAWQGRTSRSL